MTAVIATVLHKSRSLGSAHPLLFLETLETGVLSGDMLRGQNEEEEASASGPRAGQSGKKQKATFVVWGQLGRDRSSPMEEVGSSAGGLASVS